MIIIGYPGIGKTTMARNCDNVIDLESSLFTNNGARAADWYVTYCNVAMDLSAQINMVFVSSHEEVRRYLQNFVNQELIAVCYPALELKDAWIKKLEDRFYSKQGSMKDCRAWVNVKTNYDKQIRDLMSEPFAQIVIESMDYDLDKLIRRYEP